jgi:hypothetical protein
MSDAEEMKCLAAELTKKYNESPIQFGKRVAREIIQRCIYELTAYQTGLAMEQNATFIVEVRDHAKVEVIYWDGSTVR